LLTDTDQALLQRLAKGDRTAFDAIYTRHWYPLYQSAYGIFRDAAACMDIVQDVFVWLWAKREEVQIQTSLAAYLRAAVKFKTANYIRSDKVRQGFFEEALRLAAPASTASPDDIEIRELKNIIRQATENLPEKCREIFHLSRNEHLSNQEIADRLGISIKTVEGQMTTALRRIRIAVEQYMLYLLVFAAHYICG
jgi:RNA polymerase sigma-70 factor (family 1)